MRRVYGFDTYIHTLSMPPRFFHPGDLSIGLTLQLDLAAGHHASRVLRLKPGDSVVLFNGMGGEFNAHIEKIQKLSTIVAIDQFQAIERESPINIEVAQALCTNDKMDWIIQKSVELGVTRIQPLITARSVVRLSEERAAKRLQHWQKVIVSACEQCGRNRIPAIALPMVVTDWLGGKIKISPNQLNFILSAEGDQGLKNLPKPTPNEPLILAVGPEGGWTTEETTLLQHAGFIALRVGKRIMRTETAALATIAALQMYWGDF